MNDYRNTIYDIPFNGGVPYTGEGSLGASDDFSNSRPQLEDNTGAPIPGWARFDEKWRVWDVASSIAFAGVDTRVQRGVLKSVGKNFSGLYQPLPVPSSPGQEVSCVLYGQLGFAYAEGTPNTDVNVGPVFVGLMVADDLDAAPSSSGGHVLGSIYAKAADSNPQVQSEFIIGAADFLQFDTGIGGIRAGCNGAGSPQFVRYRLRQTQVDNTPNFLIELKAEWSSDGSGWLPLITYPQETRGTPLKSAGFCVYGGSGSYATISIDQWCLVLQDYKDPSSLIGGVQVLGAP